MNWLHLAVVASIVALLGVFGFTAYSMGKQAGADNVMARWQAHELERSKAVAEAQLRQVDAQRAERERIEKERQKYVQELARADAAAAGARDELERLRHVIATLAPGGAGVPQAGAPAAGAGDAGTAAQLLGECAAAHQELAREADRIATQLNAVLKAVAK
jgi:Flp pilus assembly protein TadB